MSTDNQILNFWSPVPQQGKGKEPLHQIPIGFVSTSFTFDAEFFEEECLTRFLGMETEKENDGAAFLIEREEKLAGLQCGIVLIDQHHCKGSRSLRWDLVPCRVPMGIQHAKINLLVWSGAVRVMIGSANLTQAGHCINQEIFGVVDFTPEEPGDRAFLNELIRFLDEMIQQFSGPVINGRWNLLKATLRQYIRSWKMDEVRYRNTEIAAYPLFVSPRRKSIVEQLPEYWKSASPPDTAIITSPFFDPEQHPDNPSLRIFDLLRKRGTAELNYHVTGEPLQSEPSHWLLQAPAYLKEAPRPEAQDVNFWIIEGEGKNETDKIVPRPLHAKSCWLGNDDFELFFIGSSNFTSAGWGTGRRINYEASLLYALQPGQVRGSRKKVDEALPLGEELLEGDYRFQYNPDDNDDVAEGEQLPLLPGCFGEALLVKSGDSYELRLQLLNDKIPEGITLSVLEGKTEKLILSTEAFQSSGSATEVVIPWTAPWLPDQLLVSWTGLEGHAIWPVVIDQQVSLPPVDQLRNLPLDILIQILSSSQPLHRLLKLIEKARRPEQQEAANGLVDILKLVDSSSFLLQRTRRVAQGLGALRSRLEKPVYTLEMLQWRLAGPIGVYSLVEAIDRESASEAERQFFLAELLLELTRLQPQSTDYSLDAETVKAAVLELIQKLAETHIRKTSEESPLQRYAAKALEKALAHGTD